jgi:hypothetical protein
LAHFCGDGYHGSGFAFGAYMNIEATENWSSSSRGAAITFNTVTNGTTYSTEKMRIQHDGYVGIGKTPSYALDVDGDIRVGKGSYGCVLDGNGTVIAGTCSSDERLKTDIRPLQNTLERLKKIVPVRYRMRQVREGESVNDEHLGVVAQNVEQSLPELVQVDGQGYKRVNYSAIPIVTLQALREQQDEIEFLQEVVAEQQDRLNATVALEERLLAQESQMSLMIQRVEQMQALLREQEVSRSYKNQ